MRAGTAPLTELLHLLRDHHIESRDTDVVDGLSRERISRAIMTVAAMMATPPTMSQQVAR